MYEILHTKSLNIFFKTDPIYYFVKIGFQEVCFVKRLRFSMTCYRSCLIKMQMCEICHIYIFDIFASFEQKNIQHIQ